MIDHAVYEIIDHGKRRVVRLSEKSDPERNLTEEETELTDWCFDEFIKVGLAGYVGYKLDPYDAMLDILRERFDSVEILERNYTWRPGIIY